MPYRQLRNHKALDAPHYAQPGSCSIRQCLGVGSMRQSVQMQIAIRDAQQIGPVGRGFDKKMFVQITGNQVLLVDHRAGLASPNLK